MAADPSVVAGVQHAELHEFDIPYRLPTASTAAPKR
jgi:hypothetical protein